MMPNPDPAEDRRRRAGFYVSQPEGYKAFIPKPLPPVPRLTFDDEMVKWMARAERALGRLDGIAQTLPNPELFVAMYVKKEAVLSSQIEGTQASLVDVLEFESGDTSSAIPDDVGEVINYISALNYGLERVNSLPLSLRLLKEIHAMLMVDVRGSHKSPGEFRRSQNWIGPAGCTLQTASFVPPPVHEMNQALHHLESYLHDEEIPLLVKCGLAHCQFETIHPFLDGNGRMGRLLITFLLCNGGAMKRPLLYLSYYFKKNRDQYYELLMRVRHEGAWEAWMRFFFQGVYEVSLQATETAQRIIALMDEHRRVISEAGMGAHALRLLEFLYNRPIVTINQVRDELEVSHPTASTLVGKFVELSILADKSGKLRNRPFVYAPYLKILAEGTA